MRALLSTSVATVATFVAAAGECLNPSRRQVPPLPGRHRRCQHQPRQFEDQLRGVVVFGCRESARPRQLGVHQAGTYTLTFKATIGAVNSGNVAYTFSVG